MKNSNAIAEKNLGIDAELFERLKRLGIVKSQYELSRLCGKNQSYFSSMRSRGAGLRPGTLVFLATMLAKASRDSIDARAGAVFSQAASLVQQAINRKCELLALGRRDERRRRIPRHAY